LVTARRSAVKSITFSFVTAMLRGKPHLWAIKAGDSQSGAIVHGTGGDNSCRLRTLSHWW
jgi:hypothetical protein